VGAYVAGLAYQARASGKDRTDLLYRQKAEEAIRPTGDQKTEYKQLFTVVQAESVRLASSCTQEFHQAKKWRALYD